MAQGDATDIANRLRSLLPARWFPDPGSAPTLEAVLGGFGSAWAAVFGQILFAQAQTRLRTVSGGFLDMAAADFRGTALRRRPNESDDKLRARLLPVFREHATREALGARLLRATGTTPWIFEPSCPADTGAYSAGPGRAPGAIGSGGAAPVRSTAVSSPVAGSPVYLHAAPLSGDNNVGFFRTPAAVPGTLLTATVSVWLPSGYTGGAPRLSLEGAAANAVSGAADATLQGQWQTLFVSATALATAASGVAFVLRAAGAGASNTFYSSAWGAACNTPALPGTGLGRGLAGGYGSLSLPNQLFLVAQRVNGQGIPLVAGWGTAAVAGAGAPGGYGRGAIEWGSLAAEAPHVTDADIYAMVADVMPAASIAWTRLGGAPAGGAADLGDFVLGTNTIA